MNRIISILLFACFIAAEARFTLPVAFNTNTNTNDLIKNETEKKILYRLPKTVKPVQYTLHLTPYLDEKPEKNFTFDGEVTINFDVIVKTPNITFHSKDLTFEKKDITLKRGNAVISDFELKSDADRDFRYLTNAVGFDKGTYLLTIKYTGILNNDLRGFYRSSYKNKDGKQVWLATTHFEPVGARRAFPCFDEPEYKATFDISITHDKDYIAISNAEALPPVVDPSNKEKKLTKFKTTPRMSTYLVAFVVSDFDKKTNAKQDFSVYARPNAIQHGDLALKTGEKLLKTLEEVTGIKFDIKKMDQVAIPDFSAGAMENWGLVLYREKSLLYDEKVLTTSEKQNIVETIAHEFAHQWFGNLVSPKWWKYTWLNEGFANFFQSYITEKVEPKWQSVYQSVVKSIQTTALNFDSGKTTHPINQDVESPKEISAIFDSISYQKGGAVIRMMQHFLTDSVFLKGLNKYLNDNNHKAANSDDLFKAIQQVADANKLKLDVKKIMDTWVNHKGYPVVNVLRNYTAKTVEIKQSRFITYDAKDEKEEKHLWSIPINSVTAKNVNFNQTTPDAWLSTESMKLQNVVVEPEHWIILNKQQTGFYRVNYDNENWKLIIGYLNSVERNNIHVLNRAQLMNDALAFAQQNVLGLDILLHLTAHLENEIDYMAWYPGFKIFSWLNTKFVNTHHYSTFQQYVLNKTAHLVKTVGFEENAKDEHLTKLNRVAAVTWSCRLGDDTCISKMQNKLTNWLEKPEENVISPDLKQITLCYGLQEASFDLWNKILNKYLLTTDTDEKKQLLTALGCSSNSTILQHYLKYAVADNSSINVIEALTSVHENSPIGIDTVLDFVTKKFISVFMKVMDKKRMADLFTALGKKVTTTSQLQKLKDTIENDIPQNMTSKAIELAESNIKWLEDNNHVISSWINELIPPMPHPNSVGISSGSLPSSIRIINYICH